MDVEVDPCPKNSDLEPDPFHATVHWDPKPNPTMANEAGYKAFLEQFLENQPLQPKTVQKAFEGPYVELSNKLPKFVRLKRKDGWVKQEPAQTFVSDALGPFPPFIGVMEAHQGPLSKAGDDPWTGEMIFHKREFKRVGTPRVTNGKLVQIYEEV